MTKCLQSLKEMYQDMAMQQVFCSTEAEFRQFSVLLKLNDGDILRSVESLHSSLLNRINTNILHACVIYVMFMFHLSEQ